MSIGLSPDRNFISAPGHMTLRFERELRNVCFKSFDSAFCSTTVGDFPMDPASVPTVNPFKHYLNLNAAIISLDNKSIALAERDKDYLNNLPIRKRRRKNWCNGFEDYGKFYFTQH